MTTTPPRPSHPWAVLDGDVPLWHVPGSWPPVWERDDALEAIWRRGQTMGDGVHKRMPTMTRGPWGQPAALGIHKYRHMKEYNMTDKLKSPFPWPGGKSDMAPAIWARLGDCTNYVEPFAGSAAVLLARPHDLTGKTETANDIDGHICNAFRAITFDPETTAAWCDFPVSEADLTARHLHLKAAREELTARLFADPYYFDPVLAAFWCWGIASWIGDGWCVADGPWINVDGRLVDRRVVGSEDEGVTRQMPLVSAMNSANQNRTTHEQLAGIQKYRASVPRQMPVVGSPGEGGPRHQGVQAYRHHAGVPRQMPEVGAGKLWRKDGRGVQAQQYNSDSALAAYFARLSDRLRRVRFLCGDWKRAVKDSVTVNHGLTGVFLDPPYPQAEHDMAYHTDNGDIVLTGDATEDNKRIAAIQEPWYQAAAWAVECGDDPRLRICIAGYWSEATDALFPASWERVRWEARGGYANQKADGRGRANAKRECLWFNSSCLNPTDEARDTLSRPIVVRESDYSGTMFESEPE